MRLRAVPDFYASAAKPDNISPVMGLHVRPSGSRWSGSTELARPRDGHSSALKEKLTGLTPELSPPPDLPFYRARPLAG